MGLDEGDSAQSTSSPAEEPVMNRLEVTSVEHCLAVRDEPSLDAEVLACLPEGTFVQYEEVRGINAWEKEGVVWRLLSEPKGWAEDRYLEQEQGEKEMVIGNLPAPFSEFPDDIALLARYSQRSTDPETPYRAWDRIYRGADGVVVREPLLEWDKIPALPWVTTWRPHEENN